MVNNIDNNDKKKKTEINYIIEKRIDQGLIITFILW